MTPVEFVAWLKGYLHDKSDVGYSGMTTIKDTLSKVVNTSPQVVTLPHLMSNSETILLDAIKKGPSCE